MAKTIRCIVKCQRIFRHKHGSGTKMKKVLEQEKGVPKKLIKLIPRKGKPGSWNRWWEYSREVTKNLKHKLHGRARKKMAHMEL